MKWKKLVSVICIGVGLFFLTACKEERENWKPIGDDNTIKIAIIGDDEYIVVKQNDIVAIVED